MRLASKVCRAVQTQLVGSVIEKEDRSPVTVADFASQALICRALNEAFPDIPVVGEESADALREPENAGVQEKVIAQVKAFHPGASTEDILGWIDVGGGQPAKRFWTLDPIDGTKGFLRGQQYAVALALIEDGQVVAGALGCPNLEVDPEKPDGPLGCIFSAVRGQGTTMVPLDGGDPRPVHVNAIADPAEARACESVESGHSSHDRSARVASAAGFVKDPVRLDSQTKYAVVARGQADVYWRFARSSYREKIWDHGAGWIVCTEAGGRVTDLDGKDLDFSLGSKLENNRGVLVSNGAIHDKVLAAVRSVDED